MINSLVIAIAAASLVFAALCVVLAIRDRGPRWLLRGGAGIVEALLGAQIVIAIVRMVAGERPEAVGEFVGYIIASLLVLPFAMTLATEEQTRWRAAVLAVAGCVVAVAAWRLQVIWQAGRG